MLPLLVPLPERPDPGRFELVAVDVGQGTAVLLRTQGHLLVYDTGPRWSPESDAGDRILRPLLRARGETRLDALVLSHRDTDHTGGAASLLGLPVAQVWSSLEPAHPLLADMAARRVPHAPCRAGETWTWDGVRFTWLHPVEPDPAARPNTQSCVLRIDDAAGRRVLLTGDLEAAQEGALSIADTAGSLRADVVMVPHHGSRTSSSAVFLDRVAPASPSCRPPTAAASATRRRTCWRVTPSEASLSCAAMSAAPGPGPVTARGSARVRRAGVTGIIGRRTDRRVARSLQATAGQVAPGALPCPSMSR